MGQTVEDHLTKGKETRQNSGRELRDTPPKEKERSMGICLGFVTPERRRQGH
jgi:hypothetical protein